MIIEKQTSIGKVKMEIPIEWGDVILMKGSSYNYTINRIVMGGETILVMNTYSGLSVPIEKLELIKEKNHTKYFKIKEED